MAAIRRLPVHTTRSDPIESLMGALELNLRNHQGAEPLMTQIVKAVDEAGERLAETSVQQVAEFTRNALDQVKEVAKAVTDDLDNLQRDPLQLKQITDDMNRDMKNLQVQISEISDAQAYGNDFQLTHQYPGVLSERQQALQQLSNDIAHGELSQEQVTSVVSNIQVLALETTRALDEITPREVEAFASFALSLSKATLSLLSDVAKAALEKSREGGPTIERLPSDDGGLHSRNRVVQSRQRIRRSDGLLAFANRSSVVVDVLRSFVLLVSSQVKDGFGFPSRSWQRVGAQLAGVICIWWMMVFALVANAVPISITLVMFEYYFPNAFERLVEFLTIARVVVLTNARIIWRTVRGVLYI